MAMWSLNRKLVIILLIHFGLMGLSVFAQKSRALALYPLESKIGFRNTFKRNSLFDLKLGINFAQIPVFDIEASFNKVIHSEDYYRLYMGGGLTLDGFAPGIIVPFGGELYPLEKIKNLRLVVEVSPKLVIGLNGVPTFYLKPSVGVLFNFLKKSKNESN